MTLSLIFPPDAQYSTRSHPVWQSTATPGDLLHVPNTPSMALGVNAMSKLFGRTLRNSSARAEMKALGLRGRRLPLTGVVLFAFAIGEVGVTVLSLAAL